MCWPSHNLTTKYWIDSFVRSIDRSNRSFVRRIQSDKMIAKIFVCCKQIVLSPKRKLYHFIFLRFVYTMCFFALVWWWCAWKVECCCLYRHVGMELSTILFLAISARKKRSEIPFKSSLYFYDECVSTLSQVQMQVKVRFILRLFYFIIIIFYSKKFRNFKLLENEHSTLSMKFDDIYFSKYWLIKETFERFFNITLLFDSY